MATVKVKFRASQSKDEMGKLYVQIIHNREVKHIKTAIMISGKEWRAGNYATDEIMQIVQKVESSIDFLEQTRRQFSVADIVGAYNGYSSRRLFPFMEQCTAYLDSIGKTRTAETYASTLKSLQRYMSDVDLSSIDAELVKGYEVYLLRNKVQPNTVAFYMRVFRAIYNRAVNKELTPQRLPFKQISTKAEKTIKRAITAEELKRLRDEDLTMFPSMEIARDIFMFSFYTRGMSFVDMAYLCKKNLQNGILSYRRRKTNQLLHIRWEQYMETIVQKYTSKTIDTDYLLPILIKPNSDEERQYKVAIHTINYNLKRLAKLVGITTNLTSYVARHTWASIAKSKNIPISIISQGMGHESEKTTQIYLASLDNKIIDNANFDIISDL